jgi:hypothetical protein
MSRWEAETLLCRYEKTAAAERRYWPWAECEPTSSLGESGQTLGTQDNGEATPDTTR